MGPHSQNRALWLSEAGKMGMPLMATPMAPAPGSSSSSSSCTVEGNLQHRSGRRVSTTVQDFKWRSSW
jgi:hypothetical protein